MDPLTPTPSLDDLVRTYAEFFEARGYRITAALPEHPQPDPIGTSRPDMVATRYEHCVVLLAETPESVTSARAQQEAQSLRDHCRQTRAQFIFAVTDGRVLK